MMRMRLVAAFIVLGMGGAVASAGPHVRLQAVAPWIDYDDFLKLSAHERHARFVAIGAENKATIVRTHVERWLRNNRGRLTASEAEVFVEMIAFITPDLYRERRVDTVDKRQEAMMEKMNRGVNPEDVLEATNLFREASESLAPKPRWSYLRQAKCWFEWILEGVVDYLPNTGR